MMTRIIVFGFVTIMCVIGEIMCFYKAIKCDWNPIGKSEVIYTASFFTGVGAIVGFIDIEDSK